MCTTCGASHAGEGGSWPNDSPKNPVYGSFIDEPSYLSGAGSGGLIPGGGDIVIQASTVEIHGEVRAE